MNRRQAIGLAVGAIVCPEQFVAPPNMQSSELPGLYVLSEQSLEQLCRDLVTRGIVVTKYVSVGTKPIEPRFIDPAEWFLPSDVGRAS